MSAGAGGPGAPGSHPALLSSMVASLGSGEGQPLQVSPCPKLRVLQTQLVAGDSGRWPEKSKPTPSSTTTW